MATDFTKVPAGGATIKRKIGGQTFSLGEGSSYNPNEYDIVGSSKPIATETTPPNNTEAFLTADKSGISEPPLPPEAPEPKDNEGLLLKIQEQRKTLEDARKTELDRIEKNLADSKKREDEFRALTEGTIKEGEPLTTPFREEIEKSERQRLQVEKNFFDNQTFTNELEGLLTESVQLTKKLKEQKVPGLAGLQQSERMINSQQNVQSRIGVIEAVMSARNNQIGVAKGLIDRTLTAITQDRQDRLSYLNTLATWYETQRTEEGKKIFDLTQDQKKIIDDNISLLKGDLDRSQKAADKIKDLMTDPETAGLVAEGGITLNDSEEVINKKMSDAIYAREVRDVSNKLKGAGATPVLSPDNIPQDQLYTYTDSRGKTHHFNLLESRLAGDWELKEVNNSLYRVNKKTGESVLLIGNKVGTGLFDSKTGKELSAFDAARLIITANPNLSDTELINAIRENVVDNKGQSLLDVGDAERIVKEEIAKRLPKSMTKEEIKSKIVEVLTPQKNLYSRSEAKTAAEIQLKSSLGLKEADSLPKEMKNAIEDALVQIYGKTFFQRFLPGGR